MLTEAIDYYHSLFDDEAARENDVALSAALQREGLFFGTRPICIVLRPRLLGAEHYAQLQTVCSAVAQAARKVVQVMRSDRAVYDLMAFTPGEEKLLALDAGYAEPSASSRLDSFFDNHTGSLQFVEYNAESPAGMAYEDELAAVFLDLPVMREFAKKYTVNKVPTAPRMVQTLLEKFREWNPAAEPRAAIVDWKGLPTQAEFVLFQKYLEGQGVPTLICSPDELTYSDRTLMADGQPINLVYKRVLTSELLQKYGQAHALESPLVRAYATGRSVWSTPSRPSRCTRR